MAHELIRFAAHYSMSGFNTDLGKGVRQMSKLGGKNKDSKKAAEKKMKQQLAALQRKNAKKKK